MTNRIRCSPNLARNAYRQSVVAPATAVNANWTGVLRDSGSILGAPPSSPRGGCHANISPQLPRRASSRSPRSQGANYTLTVSVAGKIWTASDPVVIKDGATLTSGLQLSLPGQELRVIVATDAASPQASGGERLSTGEVSSLPLNERDFSRLLLLAAGTMTDTNGAANFTQHSPSTASVAPPPSLPSMERTPRTPSSAALPFPTSTSTPSRKCNQLWRDARGHGSRRRRIHERDYEIRQQSSPRQSLRICPQCGLRRAEFF